ncbi:MAG: bifunctional metallophosphatase/5'-nucleotidase [Porcipelethomonas sp.]
MKKITSVCISLVMLLCMTFALPAEAGAEGSTDFRIDIVHTNDIHARIIENEDSGIIGMSKLSAIIDSHTGASDMGLVLDSGDIFHGQPVATLVKGESVAKLLKACGYDAVTAGNHDWSYGKDRLKELADIAGVKMLTGNVVDGSGNKFFEDEFLIKETEKDGKTLKTGIFGVIDPAIYSSTTPSNVEGLTFTDSAEYAKKAAEELKKQGCDIVIALSHTYDPAGLAKKVDGVDLWLCGHEHIDLNTSVTTPDGSTSYVIEDGYYLYQAGLIELNCTMDDSGDVTSVKCSRTAVNYEKASDYDSSSEVTAILDEINAEQSVILNEVVGSSPADLDGVWENLRIGETNLGRAVTAAYIKATGADIAFENAGGIRAGIKAGDVTYGDIISVSPYGNYIVTKKIAGKQLKEILETSIDIQMECIAANKSGDNDAWPQSSGSYLQTGGMTVKYNPDLKSGNRVVSVMVGDEPLDEDKLYTVATNNYVAVSKYYPQLADTEESGEFSSCDEALIEFFRQDSKVIAAAIEKPGMIETDEVPEEKEPSTEESSQTSSTSSSGTTSVPDGRTSSPKTGNDGDMTIVIIALAATGFIAVLAVIDKKRIKK